MLYELPRHRPPLTLVGPHDTTFWAALGMEPADRHALVIGAVSAPVTATVIVGTLLDLARYLDPFTGFPTTIAALAAQARAGLSADEARALRPEPPAPQRPAPVGPGTDLITLPHSGIRVPHDRFRVSRYRELPTADGVAFTATLKLDKTVVGLIQNEGTGGPTHVEPTDFPDRQLNDYVQACRTAVGQPCSKEYVLDELVTFTDR